MATPYPKTLTDPAWKKVEKAAGVSSTGVGQTLRDAERLYKVVETRLAALKTNPTTGPAVKQAATAAAAALTKSAKTLEPVIAKVKTEDKKKILSTYKMYITNVASELTHLDPMDHRGAEQAIERFDDRMKMWVKWIGDQIGLK